MSSSKCCGQNIWPNMSLIDELLDVVIWSIRKLDIVLKLTKAVNSSLDGMVKLICQYFRLQIFPTTYSDLFGICQKQYKAYHATFDRLMKSVPIYISSHIFIYLLC